MSCCCSCCCYCSYSSCCGCGSCSSYSSISDTLCKPSQARDGQIYTMYCMLLVSSYAELDQSSQKKKPFLTDGLTNKYQYPKRDTIVSAKINQIVSSLNNSSKPFFSKESLEAPFLLNIKKARTLNQSDLRKRYFKFCTFESQHIFAVQTYCVPGVFFSVHIEYVRQPDQISRRHVTYASNKRASKQGKAEY